MDFFHLNVGTSRRFSSNVSVLQAVERFVGERRRAVKCAASPVHWNGRSLKKRSWSGCCRWKSFLFIRIYMIYRYHYIYVLKSLRQLVEINPLLINLYMLVSSIHSCHSKAFGKTTLNRIKADLWTTCMFFFLFAPLAYFESCVEHVYLPFIAHKCMILMEHLSCTSTGFQGPTQPIP